MKPISISQHKGEFFSILETAEHLQVGTMTIHPGGDSGPGDIHPGNQFVYILEGEADVRVGEKTIRVNAGEVFVVPSNAEHRIFNRSDRDLFFITVYSPPAY